MKYYVFISDKWEPGFELVKIYNNKSTMIIDINEIKDKHYEMRYNDDIYTYLDTSDNTLHNL